MRKFLSTMLAIVILVSMLPMSTFATDETDQKLVAETELKTTVEENSIIETEIVGSVEEVQKFDFVTEQNQEVLEDIPQETILPDNIESNDTEQIEIPDNYGIEVIQGDAIYYIEYNDLLYSSNNSRPRVIDNDVTMVIEDGGDIYYSKLDEKNTYIYQIGKETEIEKLFCPIDCFDVDGDNLYYSYNGEIYKYDILNNLETSLYKQNDVIIFNVINGEIRCLYSDKPISEVSDSVQLNAKIVDLKDPSIYLKQGYGTKTCTLYSNIMMFRRGALINKNQNWININHDNYYSKWWGSGGMSWSPSAEGMSGGTYKSDLPYSISDTFGNVEKRREFFINNLKKHKEGIVIYLHFSTSNQHAILLTDYDEKTDTFYCADPSPAIKAGRIPLAESSLLNYVTRAGYAKPANRSIQDHILAHVTQLWVITSGITYTPPCSNCLKAGTKSFDCDGDGRCSICKTKFSLVDVSSGITPGTYKRVRSNFSKYYLRKSPYEKGNCIDSGAFSSIEIISAVSNGYGNKWYYVKVGARNGYIVADKIDADYTLDLSTVRSEITINPGNYPTGTIPPKSFSLTASVSSKYPIKSVKGEIIDTSNNQVVCSATASNINSYTYGVAGKSVDNGLRFGTLKSGKSYYLRYTVWDTTNNGADNGNGVTWQSPAFNVQTQVSTPVIQYCDAPTIQISSIAAGQRATVTNGDGSLIHVKANGRESTGYGTVTVDFTTNGSFAVEAWTTANGKETSNVVTKSLSVSRVKTPIISDGKYTDDSVMLTISGEGEIYYTTNGSTPTTWSTKYTGPIHIKDTKMIKAIAVSYGCVNSVVSEKNITVTVPDAPTITLNTEKKVAQGKTATVSWQRTDRATGYIAYLFRGDQLISEVETTGTTASFSLKEKNDTENIEYSIKVVATNCKGSSNDSNSVSVTAMHPVEVTFIDRILREGDVTDDVVDKIQQNVSEHYGEDAKAIEGNVISVQKIDYNSKPSIPAWEDKLGFSRQYFSDEAYQKITEDTIAYAYYGVKSYSVQFWNYWRDYSENNEQIGATQSILYSFSAEPPTNVEAPTGYILAGWSVDGKVSDCYDFTFVEGDMKLDTVYTWENEELPVILEVLSAKRGNTCQSYDINLKYVHYNESDTQARIIVTLYTADNKVVNVSTEDVDLMAKDAGFDYTDTITVNYPDQVSRISAVMVQVKDDMTGGAVSEMVSTTDIEMPTADTYWGKWSDWSTSEPSSTPGYNENDFQGVERTIETKTQYRYRNKDYTSSASSSLSGWTKYNTRRTGWGNTQGPVYSNPSNGARNVWSESYVTSSNYKNVYRYYRYTQYNTPCSTWGAAYSAYPYYYEFEYDQPLTLIPGNTYSYYQWCGCGVSGGYHTVYSVNYKGEAYPASKWVSYNYGTRWYYQEPIYTYDYWKWLSWSSWSDTKVSGDEIQTRTVYRYRDKFNSYEGYDPSRDSQLEEETKQTYPISGNILGLEKDYNGKLATVLVYKKTNTDPTQEQLEYVDQITLGENNSYSFVVNPKDEIDYNKTGDYIVTLSIEGCDKLSNIDIIKAPVPQYIVTFQNDDGTVLKDSNGNDVIVSVDKGSSIDVDNIPIPSKDGHRFVKWDKSLININADMTVAPIYTKNTYNIVYVDHENEATQMVEVSYGDYFDLPEVEPITGKSFVGWNVDHYKYVSDGNVDTEIYNIKEEIPYYKTTDGAYILSTLYEETIHDIIDTTEYFKYISEEKSVITESKIITANWKNIEYTVNFCDLDGNVVDTQFVEYGNTAIPPECIEKDGVVYSWDVSNAEWWNVTSDMHVYPYIPNESKVSAPSINASTEEVGGMFYAELDTAEENGTVYYSYYSEITEDNAREIAASQIAGIGAETESISLMSEEVVTDSNDNIIEEDFIGESIHDIIHEYTEPIEINEGTVVYAFTVDSEGNISPISVFEFGYDTSDDEGTEDTFEIDEDCPAIIIPDISAKPGDTVSVPITIKNNPGITGLSLVVGYDMNNLKLTDTENGDVFANKEFSKDIRDDGSCKFTWESDEVNTKDGTIVTLTFIAGENSGEYDISVTIDEAVAPDEEEQPFATVNGVLKNEELLFGDVNGDGEVDFADGIRILKHDVGLIDLTGDALVTGDVNGDGEVDFADAILVLKFDVGLISSFKK